MRAILSRLLLACVFACAASPVLASDAVESRPLQFTKGASSATVQGSLKGDKSIDYKVRAKAGQTMKVELKTSNTSNFFNVLPPGSKDVAIFIGSSDGNSWTGPLPKDGEYAIRVYLMRSSGRQGEKADYTLTVAITGSGDAKVAGTSYHATGKLPCSFATDAPGSAQCSFGVIRNGKGQAEVHFTSPGFDVTLHKDEITRLLFQGDTVSSPDPAVRVKAEKKGDEWQVEVNESRYLIIPEAVINGG